MNSAVPSPDGRRVYYFADDTLFVYDVRAGRSSYVLASATPIYDLTMAPRGDLLAFARSPERGASIAVWAMPLNPATGLAAGPARRLTPTPESGSPAISADGDRIAFATARSLFVVPSTGGAERVVVTSDRWATNTRWSPDGRFIYYHLWANRNEGAFFRIAVDGGQPEQLAETVGGGPGVSPDGEHIATLRIGAFARMIAITTMDGRLVGDVPDRDLRVWLSPTELFGWTSQRSYGLKSYSFETGATRDVLPSTDDVRGMAWSPDGRDFAAVSMDGDSVLVIIARADGSGRRSIGIPARRRAQDLSWSPDGRWIALSAGDTAQIYAVEAASGAVQRLPTAQVAEVPRWAADSRHVRYLTGTSIDDGGIRTIREVSLDGRDVFVREVARGILTWGRLVAGPQNLEGDGGWDLHFASDTTVVVKDTSAVDLISLTTGRSTRLYTGRTAMPTPSGRGDLFALRVPGSTVTDAIVVTAGGRQIGTAVFPTGIGPAVGQRVLLTPDGTNVIATGRTAAGGCCDILTQSVTGGTPKRLTSLEQGSGAPLVALSPDGTTLLFTSAGEEFITTFQTLDLAGMLQPSNRR